MDIDQRKKLILSGNMYKAIITLAIPIMINNLIQTLYNLADAFWVGKIGSVEVAATGFVWPVNFLFISLCMGISIAGTALLSRFIGAGKNEEANSYASQLLVLALISSVIFTIIGVIITPTVIRLMGAEGMLAVHSITYLQIVFIDTPLVFIFFVFNSIMIAQGNTVVPTVLSGISAVLNVILDPIFIFTFNLGVAGAAIATVLSKAVLIVAIIYFLKVKGSVIKPSFKNFRFNKNIIKQILKVGVPSALGQSGSAVGFMILNGFIVSYGTATMAAFVVVNRITSLIMQPAMGIGAALTTIVGQNLGAKQEQRAEEGFKKSINFTVIFSVIGCIFLLIWDTQVINFFMQAKDDIEVIEQGITFLWYITASMPLMGIFSVLQGVFQGSGHTKYSMAMEIGRLWLVRIPMILIFKYIFPQVGAQGIWFSMSFSNLIVCIYGYWIYRKGHWRKNVIQSREIILEA